MDMYNILMVDFLNKIHSLSIGKILGKNTILHHLKLSNFLTTEFMKQSLSWEADSRATIL
jgi:hypothetical protein